MDEDVEFRDMVLKKLEENGSLLEIKAKLRAHLYDVIENDGRQHQNQEVVNDSDLTYPSGDKTDLDDGGDSEDQQEQEPDDRTVALSLVHDLLDCLKLPFTKRVLLAESGLRKPCSRVQLQRELGGGSDDEDVSREGSPKEALLLQLIDRHRKPSPAGTSDISQVSRNQSETTTTAMTPTVSEESPAPV